MHKGRLEAFSDGVLAIIITIMVLELKAPRSAEIDALVPLIPSLLSYVLSFVLIAIYWNNHHHLWQAVHVVNGAVLWANMHLLFWLSLVPLVTHWMGDTNFAAWPVAIYGGIQIMAAIAYFLLTRALLWCHGPESKLATALGNDLKGKASIAIYAIAIALCYVHPWAGGGLYAVVAIIWLIPDRRFENVLVKPRDQSAS